MHSGGRSPNPATVSTVLVLDGETLRDAHVPRTVSEYEADAKCFLDVPYENATQDNDYCSDYTLDRQDRERLVNAANAAFDKALKASVPKGGAAALLVPQLDRNEAPCQGSALVWTGEGSADGTTDAPGGSATAGATAGSGGSGSGSGGDNSGTHNNHETIVVSGGIAKYQTNEFPTTAVWQWRRGDSVWTRHSHMNVARLRHSLVVLDGVLYAVGGETERVGARQQRVRPMPMMMQRHPQPGAVVGTTTVEFYSRAKRQWVFAEPLPEMRVGGTCVVIDA